MQLGMSSSLHMLDNGERPLQYAIAVDVWSWEYCRVGLNGRYKQFHDGPIEPLKTSACAIGLTVLFALVAINALTRTPTTQPELARWSIREEHMSFALGRPQYMDHCT